MEEALEQVHLEQADALTWVKKPAEARKYVWDTRARKIEHTWFKDGQLNVSVNTVAVHRANIMNTLGVHKTAELVVYALQRGLVGPL